MEEILLLISAVHLVYCPFTKVEESFNLQATHDILYHGFNISKYDHHEFPGVVPRTFLGPIFISVVSSPFVLVIHSLGLNKILAQYIVRCALGACVLAALHVFRRTVQNEFGPQVAWWFVAITATQYHFMYYLSRPLPNIMALPLALLAVHSWMKQWHSYFIYFSAAAIILFRGELAIFLGIFLLSDLIYRRIDLLSVVKLAIPAGLVCLSLTIVVDSFFWQRLVWPEGEVLFFNTVLNRSSDWGTSPFLWYFYSAIPRAMAFSVFLVPLGVYLEPRVRKLFVPVVIFVFLFSFLPHKELRFIIYVFPLLNVIAASACHKIWINRAKTVIHSLLALGLFCHLALNVIFTLFLLCISATNYPGGVAISRLHQLAKNEQFVHVHIDVLTAQTGVSRFSQMNPHWRYNKTENLVPGSPDMMRYTHLLIEAKSKYSVNLKPYAKTHDILESVEGFSQITLNYNHFPPIKIKTKPLIFILKRKEQFSQLYEEDEETLVPPDESREELEEDLDNITPVLEAEELELSTSPPDIAVLEEKPLLDEPATKDITRQRDVVKATVQTLDEKDIQLSSKIENIVKDEEGERQQQPEQILKREQKEGLEENVPSLPPPLEYVTEVLTSGRGEAKSKKQLKGNKMKGKRKEDRPILKDSDKSGRLEGAVEDPLLAVETLPEKETCHSDSGSCPSDTLEIQDEKVVDKISDFKVDTLPSETPQRKGKMWKGMKRESRNEGKIPLVKEKLSVDVQEELLSETKILGPAGISEFEEKLAELLEEPQETTENIQRQSPKLTEAAASNPSVGGKEKKKKKKFTQTKGKLEHISIEEVDIQRTLAGTAEANLSVGNVPETVNEAEGNESNEKSMGIEASENHFREETVVEEAESPSEVNNRLRKQSEVPLRHDIENRSTVSSDVNVQKNKTVKKKSDEGNTPESDSPKNVPKYTVDSKNDKIMPRRPKSNTSSNGK